MQICINIIPHWPVCLYRGESSFFSLRVLFNSLLCIRKNTVNSTPHSSMHTVQSVQYRYCTFLHLFCIFWSTFLYLTRFPKSVSTLPLCVFVLLTMLKYIFNFNNLVDLFGVGHFQYPLARLGFNFIYKYR